MTFGTVWNNLWRKKTVVTSQLHDTKLKRCLGLLDLIGLGVGSSLGVGVYIITSYAISKEAGPSFVISVIIAGVATLFAGLCYGELSSRLPRAGSAYFYTYVTLGEICGFVIGWNMLLEHILSAAIAAKAWSEYLNFMTNGTIKRTIKENIPWDGGAVLGDYPDIAGSIFTLIICLILVLKAKVSTVMMMILTFFNVLIVMCFVCVGYFHVNHENWTDPPGFFAHGFTGVLAGAATLIFTFTNIEAITSASEETREPCRVTSSAVTYSIFTSSVIYFCISTAVTLSIRYLPNKSVFTLPEIFKNLQIHEASSVIAVGGLIGLTASLIGTMFYLNRLLYSLSREGLLFKCLSKVSDGLQVPFCSVFAIGIVTSVIALVCKLEILLQIVSIGTLVSYSVLSISVICLRYQPGTVGLYMEYDDLDDYDFMQCTDFNYVDFQLERKDNSRQCNGFSSKSNLTDKNGYNSGDTKLMRKSLSFDDRIALERNSNHMMHSERPRDSTYRKLDSVVSSTSNGSISGLLRLPSDVVLEPNDSTWRTASLGLLIFIICSCVLSVITMYAELVLHLDSWWLIIIVFVFSILLISATVLIVKQPENRTKLYFRTPYVPFIPLLAIFINVFLMASLSFMTWIRFIVWMAIGLLVYFAYGYRHSLEHTTDEQEVVLYEITDESNEP